jgi:hypothetical protein
MCVNEQRLDEHRIDRKERDGTSIFLSVFHLVCVGVYRGSDYVNINFYPWM